MAAGLIGGFAGAVSHDLQFQNASSAPLNPPAAAQQRALWANPQP